LADWLSGRKLIPAEHDHPLLRAMRQTALEPIASRNDQSSRESAPQTKNLGHAAPAKPIQPNRGVP
jgi:hypothetical protein